MDLIRQKQNKDCLLQNWNSSFINIKVQFEAVLKIVDHASRVPAGFHVLILINQCVHQNKARDHEAQI